MRTVEPDLWHLLEQSTAVFDIEFVGARIGRTSQGLTLQVFIDHPKGVGLDDCSRVSGQLSAVLEAENPIAQRYHLEVSSPGLYRPLFRGRDFERFAGERAKLSLLTEVEGHRSFTGLIAGVREEQVLIEDSEGCHRIPLASIRVASLRPDIEAMLRQFPESPAAQSRPKPAAIKNPAKK